MKTTKPPVPDWNAWLNSGAAEGKLFRGELQAILTEIRDIQGYATRGAFELVHHFGAEKTMRFEDPAIDRGVRDIARASSRAARLVQKIEDCLQESQK